jgi:ribosomal protein S12 methylthiotransferase accessory factor
MDMLIEFPGGRRVSARYNGHTISTDQRGVGGGSGQHPTPTELFLASIGTCAGLYALRFCENRRIDPKNLAVALSFNTHPETHVVEKVSVHIELPPDFPEKCRPALVKAVNLCHVKKHLEKPPEFEVLVREYPSQT